MKKILTLLALIITTTTYSQMQKSLILSQDLLLDKQVFETEESVVKLEPIALPDNAFVETFNPNPNYIPTWPAAIDQSYFISDFYPMQMVSNHLWSPQQPMPSLYFVDKVMFKTYKLNKLKMVTDYVYDIHGNLRSTSTSFRK